MVQGGAKAVQAGALADWVVFGITSTLTTGRPKLSSTLELGIGDLGAETRQE